MSENEQIDRFAGEIASVVDRYRKEFDLSYASAIGVLQLQQAELCNEALKDNE